MDLVQNAGRWHRRPPPLCDKAQCLSIVRRHSMFPEVGGSSSDIDMKVSADNDLAILDPVPVNSPSIFQLLALRLFPLTYQEFHDDPSYLQ